MTKIKGLISAVLLFTGIFSSCTQEGEKMSVLSVNALLEVPTKGQITSFADGDQIGLLVTDLDEETMTTVIVVLMFQEL